MLPNRDETPSKIRRGPSDEEVERRVAKIDDQNFYEILGVDSKAPSEAIDTAYFQLAKLWHPDRLPPASAHLRGTVAKIFTRMNEAYQTLTDSERRFAYDGVVEAGGGTAKDRELVERAVDSAVLFQKAEVMFRRGYLEQAEKMLAQCVETDPQQPEYQSLLAWIQAKRMPAPELAEGEKTQHYRDQIKTLSEVLEKEPTYERALFYRAELLKKSGDLERAMKDYRKVVKLNKRNIDAAREVRLYDLRKQKSDAGMFGRLFGGKPESKKPQSGKPRK